nr:pentatricopeptide repeat-containing protein At1g63330-like isoform X1 [Ipomoea trifida]
MDEAKKAVGRMVDTGLRPDVRTYNTLINGYCKIKKLDEAMHLFREIRQNGLCPNVVTYTTILQGLFLVGRCATALKFLQEMQVAGHKLNYYTSCVLLKGLCDNGLVEKAMSVYSKIDRNGSGSQVFGRIMIDAFCKTGLLNIARAGVSEKPYICYEDYIHVILLFPNQYGSFPHVQNIYKASDGDNRAGEAVELFRKLVRENVCKINQVTCGILITGLCKTGYTQTALDLLGVMQKEGLEPDTTVYNIIIDALCKDRMIDQALDLLTQMIGRGILPDKFTYASMIQGLCNFSRWKEEMQVAGHKPNFHTSCVLLKGLCENGHVEKAMSIYSKLDKNGNGSHVFGDIMINAFCKTGLLNIARGIFINLSKVSCTNVNTYTIMINGFFREGLTDEALDLLRKMKENDILPDTATYNVILQEFVRKKMCNEANMVLDEMVGMGISPNGYTLSLVNDLLALQTGNNTVLRMMQKFAANDVR